MDSKYLSINRFADESGLSPRDISEAIRSGDLEAERCSGRWVIERAQAEDYVADEECDDYGVDLDEDE